MGSFDVDDTINQTSHYGFAPTVFPCIFHDMWIFHYFPSISRTVKFADQNTLLVLALVHFRCLFESMLDARAR